MGFFDTKPRKKQQTYKSVLETMKAAGIIKAYVIRRVTFDALSWTSWDIEQVDLHNMVNSISAEVYGKNAELYIRTGHPNALWQSLMVAGIDLSKATKQENRIVLPVSFFKGYHWWE